MSTSASLMTKDEWRLHELNRARELVRFLEPVDPWRLGLYAVLDILADEAISSGRFSTACIAERKIHAAEGDTSCKIAMGYALLVSGCLLGHMGEEGWKDICIRAAHDQDLPGCFPVDSFRIVQRPHEDLNWRGHEEDEVKVEIARRRLALQACDLSEKIRSSTLPASGQTPRRGL